MALRCKYASEITVDICDREKGVFILCLEDSGGVHMGIERAHPPIGTPCGNYISLFPNSLARVLAELSITWYKCVDFRAPHPKWNRMFSGFFQNLEKRLQLFFYVEQ